VKRLSPNAMWWLTFAPLIVVDALARWAFSWHRPLWLDVAAGVAYGALASAVSSHFAQPTKARDDAPEEPS
jgi:hypothetical protein